MIFIFNYKRVKCNPTKLTTESFLNFLDLYKSFQQSRLEIHLVNSGILKVLPQKVEFGHFSVKEGIDHLYTTEWNYILLN